MIHDFPPRLMSAPSAARYIGVSESTLSKLDIRRKELRAKRMYDKADLDAYVDSLPYEGAIDDDEAIQSCDSVFGIVK